MYSMFTCKLESARGL